MSNFPERLSWLGSVQLRSDQIRKHERVTDSSLSAGGGKEGREGHDKESEVIGR
jgi:hypothetical protein